MNPSLANGRGSSGVMTYFAGRVEAVMQWYAKTAVEPEIRDGSALAATLFRKALETRCAELQTEQGMFWDDLEDVA